MVILIIAFVIFLFVYMIIKNTKQDNNFANSNSVTRYSDSDGEMHGSIGGDVLQYDTNNKTITFYANNKRNRYSFSDILQCEIIENGKTTVKKSTSGTIGRALLGGLLAGGVGAIIGGTTSSSIVHEKINRISIRVIVNDPNHPSWEIHYLNSIFGEQKGSYLYNSAMASAKNVHAMLSGFIQIGEQMREVQNHVVAQQVLQEVSNINPTNKQISVADELMKLKSLLDSNIITQDEFNVQKKKLLN